MKMRCGCSSKQPPAASIGSQTHTTTLRCDSPVSSIFYSRHTHCGITAGIDGSRKRAFRSASRGSRKLRRLSEVERSPHSAFNNRGSWLLLKQCPIDEITAH